MHSVLASRTAKSAAARVFGERNRNAFYRPFYIAQSVISFGGLIAYMGRLPNRTMWRTGPNWSVVFNLSRAAALVGMVSAARQIGISRLTGAAGVRDWKLGEAVPPEPEAQGPALDNGSPISGPFRLSRHPLNFLGLPLIWLTPQMSRNRFVFNLVSTAYLLLGSWHEEHRLRLRYGEKYEAYKRGTSFFFGRKRPGTLRDGSFPKQHSLASSGG